MVVGNNYKCTKEYFSHKNILLFHGDILNEELFDKQFIDLIVTSPPYNLGIKYNSTNDNINYEQYLEFSEQWMRNCYNWSKTQARFCLNIPLNISKYDKYAAGADLTKIAQKVGWKYKFTIIWNEGTITKRTAWGSWKSASSPYVLTPVELIVVLYKDEWKKTNGTKISDITEDEFKSWTNGVWKFNGESKKRVGHPAPFPKELPYRCIKLFSYKNDVVFDAFAGSGTTLLVAENLDRQSVGTEIDSEYFKLAKNRIFKETGTLNFGVKWQDTESIGIVMDSY